MILENNKGLVEAFVVSLVILLITFIILFAWMWRAGIIFETDTDMNLCRATLTMQKKTQANLFVWDFDSPLNSNCKRRLIEVERESITVRSQSALSIKQAFPLYLPSETDPDKLVRTTKYEVDKEELNSFVAESMRRCWLMGVEGRVEVFNPETFIRKSNVCIICDQIEVKLGVEHELNGLEDYLTNTEMPVTSKNDVAQTYASFLNFEGPKAFDEYPRAAECQKQIRADLKPTIRDGSYATVAVRQFADASIRGSGCMTVTLVPTSRLRYVCNYVAN